MVKEDGSGKKRENRNETYSRLLFYVNDSFLGFMTWTCLVQFKLFVNL